MLITDFPTVRTLIRRREALGTFLAKWTAKGITEFEVEPGITIPWNRLRNAIENEITATEAELIALGVQIPEGS